MNVFDADMGNLLWGANSVPGAAEVSFSEDGKAVTVKSPKDSQTFDTATGKRLK